MTTAPIHRPTVLVTGSSGTIGQCLPGPLHQAGFHSRGLDLTESPGYENTVVGGIHEPDTVARAVRGVHTMIHLAAQPNEADFFEGLLQPNVEGLLRVLRAAREASLRRIILASSVQVHNGSDLGQMLTLEQPPKPTNHYGLTKLWAEQTGEMYARCYGLSVLAVRIGAVPRRRVDPNKPIPERDYYFSHDDAAQLFTKAVLADRPGLGEFAVVFGVSRPRKHYGMDPQPARELLGYEPQDVHPHGCHFPAGSETAD
jgi:nucleoside-diphosphate-sugar epimerase